MKPSTKPLKRAVNTMPRRIKQMLKEAGLWDAYIARPPYQRNDYLGWIRSAKLPGTAQKRTQQMLEELRKGDTYMKMRWKPR